MACLICGEERTVESHLVPRALYRDIAGDEQHGFEGSAFALGVKLQAKGRFDRTILCAEHEQALNDGDTYGVRFIRSFHSSGRPILGDAMWEVPNPRPEQLVKFVAACIWRRGVSKVGREQADLSLGAAEPRLRSLLFGKDATYDPPLMVARKVIVSQGEPLHELMFEPAKSYGFGDNTWAFELFGVSFTMKLNPHSSPSFPAVSLANRRDPLWAWNFPPTEISQLEGALNLAVNMFRDPRTGGMSENLAKRRRGGRPSTKA